MASVMKPHAHRFLQEFYQHDWCGKVQIPSRPSHPSRTWPLSSADRGWQAEYNIFIAISTCSDINSNVSDKELDIIKKSFDTVLKLL